MLDRHTIMIPCQECKRTGVEYLVEADVQDDVLEEYKVERADELELSDGELNLLLAEERISPEHTCSHCGSDSNREGEEDD